MDANRVTDDNGLVGTNTEFAITDLKQTMDKL